MAFFTLGTVTALVGVIGGVAGGTSCFELLAVERALVAGAASGLCVAMKEREFRLGAVVENGLRPIICFVASRAVVPMASAVDVIRGVAGPAVARRVLVTLTRVTQAAVDLRVVSL